jgi:hypothetical protein
LLSFIRGGGILFRTRFEIFHELQQAWRRVPPDFVRVLRTKAFTDPGLQTPVEMNLLYLLHALHPVQEMRGTEIRFRE